MQGPHNADCDSQGRQTSSLWNGDIDTNLKSDLIWPVGRGEFLRSPLGVEVLLIATSPFDVQHTDFTSNYCLTHYI